MTLQPISMGITRPNTPTQWAMCPPYMPSASSVMHDDLENTPRFGSVRSTTLALLAATLVGTGLTGCANSRYNVPHTPQARLDAQNANNQPRGARLGTYLENEYGMSTEKANAILLLPYAQFSGFFPSRFDVNNQGSAVSDSQSVLPELARREVTAQDIRDLRALLVDPASVRPELVLKYDLNTQRRQILSTVRSRSMNREFRASGFSQKPLTYAEIIKTDLFMTQQRSEAEMADVYRGWGLSKTQVESLATIGDVMASHDHLPNLPGITFEGPVNFPKGLTRHWQQLGVDHPKSLALLSDAHFEAMRDTVQNAQPKPHPRLNKADALMAADREFMKWVKTEAEFGNIKYWANKPPADFARFLADKAGYQPLELRPPARLLPPMRDDEALPPADTDRIPPAGILDGPFLEPPVSPLPKAMPKPNPSPQPAVPYHPERIAGNAVPGTVVSEAAKR